MSLGLDARAMLAAMTTPGMLARSDPRAEWNTALSPEQESAFQAWAEAQSRALGRNVSDDLQDYDLRGLYRDSGGAGLGAGHFTDKYKKPNHPTFSAESQYSGQNGIAGGRWVQGANGWEFYASPHNVQNLGPDGLRSYFEKREPGARLVLPDAQALANAMRSR